MGRSRGRDLRGDNETAWLCFIFFICEETLRRAAFALDMDFITSEEQYAAERAALEAWTAVNIDVAYRELVLNTQKSRARRLLSTLSGARVARGL